MGMPDVFYITNLVSGTASCVSSAFWLWNTVRISGQVAVSSGSMVGTVQFQVSNDQPKGAFQNAFQPTNWNTLGSGTSTPSIVTCSNTATTFAFLLPSVDLNFSYGRVLYNDLSAGAAIGTFNVNVKTYGI